MCGQNYCIVPCKSICRSSRCGKMYLTMKDKFFVPGLMHYLRSFIKGCHICQLARPDKPTIAPLNFFELQTIVKIEYGSEGNAQITKRS